MSSAAAVAASAASPRPPSSALYTERLFYAVLKQGNPSEARVEALAALALRHLPRYTETWAALRKALMEESDLDGALNRTLWYVLDALIKHAPHVFVPLLAPRLLEYTVQQLPWGLARRRGQNLLWFEALVLSWEKVLPQRLYSAIRQHAVQSRSGAELHNLLEVAQTSADDGTPASATELQQLRDAWDAVQYMGEQEAGKFVFYARHSTAALEAEEELVDRSSSSSALVSGLHARVSRNKGDASGLGSTGDDAVKAQEQQEEDEYTPDFVEGAKPRELPQLNLPKMKRRREGRRRPRDDDLGM
ncbi:hypothetical protein LSCM1_05170 [Leishmania martiniquensis]|uniref:Uncharacterized protein n=1 Tax=Leishmania martiniquensis TaxID=1580590 RepID=A0A836HJK7_9TRYP|nr:hypothetical protein LSCM1_05170 [Leishmania martiniquensis]